MVESDLYLGLISGTSADGIDAALVGFGELPQLHCGRTSAYSDSLRSRVLALSQHDAPALSLDAIGALHVEIGYAFANAAKSLIAESGINPARIRAIGSHGQTLRHRPSGEFPFTLQLGDASVIAECTGIASVADFRARDVAAGGHGAPLMPAFHAAFLSEASEDRAVLNLGGIANFTLLPKQGPVRGFDTGPANGLMDAWAQHHLGASFDADGAFASRGRVDAELLARLLDDPWFALPPPKSTGRDQFHMGWLQSRLTGTAKLAEDVQATLCELTAVTVTDALRATQPGTASVLVCGGGVHNAFLLSRIAAQLPGIRIESTTAHGLDPDFVEAMGFAWLARETLAGRPGNLPDVTGARGPRVLGAIHTA
ncbi:MAG: anhydro-N-acetylmuramic acid kinase [Lysobacteraceae bacterium]